MTQALPYSDRSEAGRVLAAELRRYTSKEDVLVLGLARGGIAVASEIARDLQAPLDVLTVRKLSLPSEPELALGAVAVDGTTVLDEELILRLGISGNVLDTLTRRVRTELERRDRLYRSGRPRLDLANRTVILADDGLATGSTMLAAVRSVKKQSAKQIVVAVPVAAGQAIDKLRAEVDLCVCPATPEWFYAVSEWYDSFPQVTDADVTRILEESCRQPVRQ